jgi:hypothetical protein
MPLVWNLDGVSRVVRMRYIAPIAFTEWRDAHDASLPALSGDRSVGLLLDRRDVPPPATAFAQAIASYLASHRTIFEGRRIAILVTVAGDACYGMARMQSVLNESAGAVTCVFTSELEALVWLASAEQCPVDTA